jgi:hypothetical protein
MLKLYKGLFTPLNTRYSTYTQCNHTTQHNELIRSVSWIAVLLMSDKVPYEILHTLWLFNTDTSQQMRDIICQLQICT